MWNRTAISHQRHSANGARNWRRTVPALETRATRSTDYAWPPAIPDLRSNERIDGKGEKPSFYVIAAKGDLRSLGLWLDPNGSRLCMPVKVTNVRTTGLL